VEIRKIRVEVQPKQKVTEIPTPANKKLGMVLHAYHPSYAGDRNRRPAIQTSLAENLRLFSNNN
jgi:hypothetical protein